MDEELKKYLEGMKAELLGAMRDMQTELLRGFAAHSGRHHFAGAQSGSGSIEPGRRAIGPGGNS